MIKTIIYWFEFSVKFSEQNQANEVSVGSRVRVKGRVKGWVKGRVKGKSKR